jgi:hypothetical protein
LEKVIVTAKVAPNKELSELSKNCRGQLPASRLIVPNPTNFFERRLWPAADDFGDGEH